MVNAEETKKCKARQMRYKRPIVKNMNLETIIQDLWNIQEECENIRWYTESEDGTDSLVSALDGDEDETWEFKMAFADLCAECERMFRDLGEEWVPECFDIFFVAAGAGDYYNGLLGYDTYEMDYYGLSCTDSFAQDVAYKRLKQMKKDELIAAARQCIKVFHAYLGLRNRYDNLKAAIDILQNQNGGYLQVVKEIDRLYMAVSDKWNSDWSKASIEWKMYTDALPQEAWIA